MNDKPESPFFIGYRPFPVALRWFYGALAAVFIAASGGVGYWLAAQQPAHAAAGEWDAAASVTLRGVLMLRPYPVLHRLDATAPGGVDSVLLVRQGKHAADDWAREFAGQTVTVRGYPITRGRWKMLEIPAADAIAVDAGAGGIGSDGGLSRHPRVPLSGGDIETLRTALTVESLGAVELSGEIVDSKCFLGVMKPGAGLTHKACAELCLLGGIPPILVAADAAGEKTGYLLARADGGSAAVALAEFAAEPVRVAGRLQRQGGLLVLRVGEVARR